MYRQEQPANSGKKRTAYAPGAENRPALPAIIGVELDEDEDVEWIWTHTPDGESVVTGYTIIKRIDPRRAAR